MNIDELLQKTYDTIASVDGDLQTIYTQADPMEQLALEGLVGEAFQLRVRLGMFIARRNETREEKETSR